MISMAQAGQTDRIACTYLIRVDNDHILNAGVAAALGLECYNINFVTHFNDLCVVFCEL